MFVVWVLHCLPYLTNPVWIVLRVVRDSHTPIRMASVGVKHPDRPRQLEGSYG